MTLTNGIYNIIQRQREGLLYLGCDERSKKIITLPGGGQAPRWEVKWVGGDEDHLKYRLSIQGAPTGILNDHVFAFSTEVDEKNAVNWVIEDQSQQGLNNYTVCAENGALRGWTVPTSKSGVSGGVYQQVAVEPLMLSGGPIPFRFWPMQLFEFVRID